MATCTKMLPLENETVKRLTEPTEFQEFHEQYVKQVEKARDGIFIDICNGIKLSDFDHRYVAARYLGNSRHVTKEKLAGWLETVAHILDQYCIPWLQKAAPLAEEVRQLRSDVGSLKAENADYQKRIIDLQNQLIVKQEEQLTSVKSTVEAEMKTYSAAVKETVGTEMKTYSSAVSKSCSAALAPKKLQTAVKKVAEKEERSKNVIIYGLEENSNEELQAKVFKVLEEIGDKPVIEDCLRIGALKENSTRPVKFSLRSSAHVAQVLRNARKLRTLEGYESVYICPDRSLEERRAYKKLVDELKEKRDSERDKVHFIRHNKVVSSTRNVEPAVHAGKV